MKLILAMFIGACCAVQAYADDNCASAVDAADSMNVNQKDCDYTNEGLNGVLHKAFKKGSEGAVLETAEAKSAVAPVAAVAAVQTNKVTDTNLSLRVEVDQWSNVALARTQLLPKAMEKCPKGFSVQRENYRPLPMGRIDLTIEFTCFK
ncbi:MAG TPA: hypothetical protein VLC79_03725 [Cellvibrio sp.]|nr:hypothetical protein [Cellvibrio sp.]